MTARPAPKPGSWAILALAVAALLAVVVVPIVLLRDEVSPEPEPTPAGKVVIVAKELHVVPDLPPERRDRLVQELRRLLVDLYTRAFSGRTPIATPPPSPEPTPSTTVDDLFTERALQALRSNPDVFRPIETVQLGSARVEFGGVATIEGSEPREVLLEVDFRADGLPEGRTSPEVRMHQRGKLYLVATSRGWQVDGFDLTFDSRPEPTPTPVAS